MSARVPRRRKKIPAHLVVDTGAKARSWVDDAKVRLYVPWKVTMEVQLSPLLITTDTLDFYMYAESGEVATKVASRMLQLWQQGERNPQDGYPKPAGKGNNKGIALARQIADKEFTSTWKQAENEGKEVRKAMAQDDPTGFHIKPKSTIIYVPGTTN
jgi:hypothetical protein